jgi:Flp pilus assembly protein TadD
MAQAYIDIKSQDAHAIAVLAWYRANLGQESQSRALIERAAALNIEQGEVAFWAAQSLALLGDADGARAWMQRALDGGVNRQRIEASPTLRTAIATTAPKQVTQATR